MKTACVKTPKRTIIGAKDFRLNMAKYMAAARGGKSFLVVHRSQPAFNITPPVDEWGDEGTWETVIDFTKIKKGGVPIKDLLERLEKM